MGLDFLAHLRADSSRFVSVLADTDPETPVPSCPDWSAADLLWHLAGVQHFWGTIVGDRLTDSNDYDEPARPEGHLALLEFFETSSSLLIEALATTADEVAVWTWFDADQTVGFVRRRQAHEALIHRLDAELTAGVLTGLDRSLATDGVLEALEWMFGGPPAWATAAADGPIGHLATTDTDVSWTLQVGHWSGTSPNTGVTYIDELVLFLDVDGDPSFEITGTAGDLDAWVWNRPTLGEIGRSGDTQLFETLIRSGVQ